MTKYFLYIIVSIALFISCKNEVKPIVEPNNKLSEKKFINLLLDVNLLEGYLTNINVNLPAIQDTSLGQYKTIFDKYNITYKDYKENYDYYIQQDNYKDILLAVKDSLDTLGVKYEKIEAQKQISFTEYKALFEKDSVAYFLLHDTVLTHHQKVDSLLNFYKLNAKKLKEMNLDFNTFERNVLKFRKSKTLFKSVMNQVYTDK